MLDLRDNFIAPGQHRIGCLPRTSVPPTSVLDNLSDCDRLAVPGVRHHQMHGEIAGIEAGRVFVGHKGKAIICGLPKPECAISTMWRSPTVTCTMSLRSLDNQNGRTSRPLLFPDA